MATEESKHRMKLPLYDLEPQIEQCFIAPNSTVGKTLILTNLMQSVRLELDGTRQFGTIASSEVTSTGSTFTTSLRLGTVLSFIQLLPFPQECLRMFTSGVTVRLVVAAPYTQLILRMT